MRHRSHALAFAPLFLLALAASPAAAKQVKLDARLGTGMVLAGARQTAYLKIGLQGVALPEARRTPVNVALVLDKSGSMAGERKMENAKEAAVRAVDALDRDDIVSIVAYDHTVQVLVPATKVRDRAAIRRAIFRLRPAGNTALFAGVSKGADELRKFLDRNRVNRVILLSDGLANVGPSSPGALGQLGASLAREGISVTTLGLGLGYNEDLMERLARLSDGNHMFVERADQLARIFEAEFGEVLSVVGQNARVRVVCAEGVRPVRVLGRDADITGQTVYTTFNQVYGGQEKFIIVEVELPAGAAGGSLPVASVSVEYSDMGLRQTARLQRNVTVGFSGSPRDVEAHRDRDVMISAVALVANERNRQAVVLRDAGDVKAARKTLLDNAAFLQQNASRYRSKSLESQREDNRKDADNLQGKRWKRQRKAMRRMQHKFDLQQGY